MQRCQVLVTHYKSPKLYSSEYPFVTGDRGKELAATDASLSANFSHPASQRGPFYLSWVSVRGYEGDQHNGASRKALVINISKCLCLVAPDNVDSQENVLTSSG
jgi:hypothetical protein